MIPAHNSESRKEVVRFAEDQEEGPGSSDVITSGASGCTGSTTGKGASGSTKSTTGKGKQTAGPSYQAESSAFTRQKQKHHQRYQQPRWPRQQQQPHWPQQQQQAQQPHGP
ncbi:hypothetical protein MMC07_006728, partial [Pseudocyphellaria aurata]|nr:hypothetical protein [Pseudocyphellaria aurata]